MDNKYTVGIITASDKGSKGEREDISGRRIRETLPAENYEVVSCKVLPDEQEELEQEMIHLADECKCNLILTTGGTGFSMRDVTPEATLIVNLPGSPKAVEESLTYILDSLEHGMDILLGRDGECARR